MLRYLLQNGPSIIQDLIVRESQHADTLLDHIGVAVSVVMPLLVSFMHRAVTLNDQTRLATIEVSQIIAELMLSSEFESE